VKVISGLAAFWQTVVPPVIVAAGASGAVFSFAFAFMTEDRQKNSSTYSCFIRFVLI
jgi:hypothetical protein